MLWCAWQLPREFIARISDAEHVRKLRDDLYDALQDNHSLGQWPGPTPSQNNAYRNQGSQNQYRLIRQGLLKGGSREAGVFLIFLIHSATHCSASSSCSMVIDQLRWFLAWVILFTGDQELHTGMHRVRRSSRASRVELCVRGSCLMNSSL
jgi:hypothetical protein